MGKLGIPAVRLQFDLSKKQVEKMDGLMKETGVKTKKELVITALSLLLKVVEEKKQGRTIMSIKEDGKEKELVLPFF